MNPRSTTEHGVVVIVGNPSAASRTLAAARLLGERLETLTAPGKGVVTLDLAELGPALLGWGDPSVGIALEQVRQARLVVVASPTYKASITGLCKLFLDQFGQDELAGVPAVPMMTGASAAHSLAVEVHLRPVLVEIGASCPTRGLYLSGDQIDDPAPAVEAWLETAAPVLARLARS